MQNNRVNCIIDNKNKQFKLKKIAIDNKTLQLLNPFHWGLWFSQIIKSGGFDIVVGNPPYIQLQDKNKISESEREYYRNMEYGTFNGNGDIYCLFYERGIKLLKEEGYMCYITSNKWLKTAYGEILRKYFLTKVNPILLLDFASIQIFDTATVDTAIMLLEKKQWSGLLKAVKFGTDFAKEKSLSDYIANNSVILKEMGYGPWSILAEDMEEIKNKIERKELL